jgi:hypothetical protein
LKFPNTARLAAALILLHTASPSTADELPTPFEAEYEGAKFPFSATATIALQRIGDYYRYSMRGSVRAAFFKWTDVYDCSLLRVRGNEFIPVEYVHRYSREPDRNTLTRFDWEHRKMHMERGDGTAKDIGELPPIAWDLMSVQVRLRADVAAANRGAELSYDVVEKDEVRKRHLTVEGLDDAQLNDRTLKVMKAEAVDGKHRHQFWFAKNYAWLPVRVSIDGVSLDLASPPEKAARAAAPAGEAPPSCQ